MATQMVCDQCGRNVEASFKGKPLGDRGYCVGFDTCLQDFAIANDPCPKVCLIRGDHRSVQKPCTKQAGHDGRCRVVV